MEEKQVLDDQLETGPKTKIKSATLFSLLYIASFGLYGVWWFYQTWKYFKEKEDLDIMPAARALFSIIFAYSLFENIQENAIAKGYDKRYSSGLLATIYIVILLLGNFLPEPFWIISLMAFIPMIPPLNSLNFILKNEEGNEAIEGEISGKHLAILIIGGLLWILMLYGLSLGDQ